MRLLGKGEKERESKRKKKKMGKWRHSKKIQETRSTGSFRTKRNVGYLDMTNLLISEVEN